MKLIYLFLLFANVPCLAQHGEVFLNQGEINGNPILLEDKRILINCDDKLSFWDVDRSMLLKSYASASPVLVSSKGNYLVATTSDSLSVYTINTQQKISFKNDLSQEYGAKLNAWFTENEKFFITTYEQLPGTRVKIFNTENWTEENYDSVNNYLREAITPQIIDVEGNTLLIYDGNSKLKYIDLEKKGKIIWDSLFIDQVSTEFPRYWLPFAGGKKIMLYAIDGSGAQTNIRIYDLTKHSLEKRYTLNFQADMCYPDFKAGRLVFRANPYVPNSGGFKYAYLNILTGLLKEGVFPEITNETFNYPCDFQNLYGHFLIRCSLPEKVYGVNLDVGKAYTLKGFPKLNWMSIEKNNILYRLDKDNSTYTLFNTLTGNIKNIGVTNSLIYLNKLSLNKKISVIEKENSSRYNLASVQEDGNLKAYKIIETKSIPLDIACVGKSGSEYFFNISYPNTTLGDNNEFDNTNIDVPTLDLLHPPQFSGFSHDNSTGYTSFFKSKDWYDTKTKLGNGYIYSVNKKNKDGFERLDSVCLIDNSLKTKMVCANGLGIDSAFGDNISTVLASNNLHISGNKSMIFFTYINEVYSLNISNHKFSQIRKFDISKRGEGYYSVSIQNIGFCNRDKNIYVVYTFLGQSCLEILESNSLNSIFSYKVNDNVYNNIIVSPIR